ncbi:uncharacterized protein LOC111374068 [Olea europaea var. sylvestris]|uniref:uncharacterized protein LOC111374068 n=1 Tax=Olea europaea var. sylvestris TaxID=158386 RepID=UPI000C1CDEF1|nr:uncharacterized protein LOC111374068 [Olea europaea var. sylvestris]
MIEDTSRTKYDAEIRALRCINSFLEVVGKSVNNFCFTDFDITINDADMLAKMILEESANINVESDMHFTKSLNKEKQFAYDTILDCVLNDRNGIFFIDGPGGAGVVASLLPAGRTGHSRFKIPLQISHDMRCSVSKQSALGQLLKMTKLIVWDEAPMVNKYTFEALDKILKDITERELSFGGKYSIQLPLTENMRARLDPSYSEYLLKIGNGIEKEHMCRMIKLPSDIVIDIEYELKSLKNFHEVIDKIEGFIPEDFLNRLTPNGIPPHELVLKKIYPVTLLRNINSSEGDKHSAPFKRTQFSIRPCFAITINKAQGQTLDFVGLYLLEPVFFTWDEDEDNIHCYKYPLPSSVYKWTSYQDKQFYVKLN